jgi:hypothetical protein
MLIVEAIARIRREHFFKSKTIKEIAREPEGVAEYGSERVEVGRDLLRIRAAGGSRPKLDDGQQSLADCCRRTRPNWLVSS